MSKSGHDTAEEASPALDSDQENTLRIDSVYTWLAFFDKMVDVCVDFYLLSLGRLQISYN